MRNVIEVHKAILDVVVEYENEIVNDGKEGLIISLKKVHTSMMYSPPELLYSSYFFKVISEMLNQYISMEDYNDYIWCKEIIDIFTDQTYNKCKN